MELSGAISEDIPQALIDAGYDTVAKIQDAFIQSIMVVDEYADSVAFFDAVLMYKDGDQWIKADEEHFPEDGVLQVLLPYPAGTDINTSFVALHMFTSTAFGNVPGDIELMIPENTEEGILVTVTGLSPIALAWASGEGDADAPADTTEPADKPSDSKNPFTGDTGVAMFAVLMLVAAMGMGVVLVIGKKRTI